MKPIVHDSIPEQTDPLLVADRGDKSHLRRTILSYKYEVDRLASDYASLSAEYKRVEREMLGLLAQHNRMVAWLRSSIAWRLMRKALSVINRMLGRGRYVDLLQEMSSKASFVPHVPIQPLPELPSIPEIDYVAAPVPAEKSWAGTSFIKTYYYNQLDQILARQPEGARKIFVQTPIIDWFVPLYQRPQHMALAMAKQGYLVFYMTANMLGDRASGFHEIEPNVFITNQPVHLMLDSALVSFYSTVATLLTWQGKVIEKVRSRGNKLLYEYIDHIDPEISFHTTEALARQFSLVDDSHVDLALASATELQSELSRKLSQVPVAYVPNGVDAAFYREIVDADARATVPPVMREVIEAGRPIVGYFGAMAPWLWYPMLNELAARRPDLSFVYLGPDYLNGSKLLHGLSNVYVLGPVNYSLLPYHAQHFDVAMIPFKPGEIARTTSPLKLFEYFALGKPVVVTDGMLECQKYEDVLVAGSAKDYSRRIDDALKLAGDAGFMARCCHQAEANTWDVRARTLAEAHAGLKQHKIEADF